MAKKCHNHRLEDNLWHREEVTQCRHSPRSYSTIYMYISSSFSFQCEHDKFDESISPDEGLFERNM